VTYEAAFENRSHHLVRLNPELILPGSARSVRFAEEYCQRTHANTHAHNDTQTSAEQRLHIG
jgi:hypothetical protein